MHFSERVDENAQARRPESGPRLDDLDGKRRRLEGFGDDPPPSGSPVGPRRRNTVQRSCEQRASTASLSGHALFVVRSTQRSYRSKPDSKSGANQGTTDAEGARLYSLVFYVPESHVEDVKAALFEAGAGRVGDYVRCAWQVLGTGQFQPAEGSRPFLGQHGRLECVDEFRVEMVCPDDAIDTVIRALRDAHPYEEPAFHFWKVNAWKVNEGP